MLLTNQRLDKLAASRVDFTKRGMLEGTCLSSVINSLRMSFFVLRHYDQIPLASELGHPHAANQNAIDSVAEQRGQGSASMQADNDEAVADNCPTNLTVHVELVRTPHMSNLSLSQSDSIVKCYTAQSENVCAHYLS